MSIAPAIAEHYPALNEAQRAIVGHLDGPLLVIAGPGSGTILPLMLSEGINRRGLPPERVAAVTSYNAARLFGLYPRKGAIAVGADADIVVADLGRRVTVGPELLDLDFTLFDGESFQGWPELTLLRGRVIARDGQVVGEPSGRYLRRSL